MSKLPPSKKKKEKARKDGKQIKSSLLSSSCALFCFCFALPTIFSLSWVKFKILLEYIAIEGGQNPVSAAVIIGEFFLKITGSCLILVAVISIFVEVSQVGVFLNPAVLVSGSSRIGLVSGVRRIISGVTSSWFLLLKLLLCALTLWCCISSQYETLVFSTAKSDPNIVVEIFETALRQFVFWGTLLLVVLGALDYWINRRKYFRENSMTPEEARREHREDEGDPMIKSQRRFQHSALALESVVNRIKRSKVVVVETASK